MSARKFDIFNENKRRYGNVTIYHTVRNTLGETIKEVQLHKTVVVRWNRPRMAVNLYSGGWKTLTTKTAMNVALKQIYPQETPQILSIKGVWHLNLPRTVGYPQGQCLEYREGMTVESGFENGRRVYHVFYDSNTVLYKNYWR